MKRALDTERIAARRTAKIPRKKMTFGCMTEDSSQFQQSETIGTTIWHIKN